MAFLVRAPASRAGIRGSRPARSKNDCGGVDPGGGVTLGSDRLVLGPGKAELVLGSDSLVLGPGRAELVLGPGKLVMGPGRAEWCWPGRASCAGI